MTANAGYRPEADEAARALRGEQVFALKSLMHSLDPDAGQSFYHYFNEGLNMTARQAGLQALDRAADALDSLRRELDRALAARDRDRVRALVRELSAHGPVALDRAMESVVRELGPEAVRPPYVFRHAGSFGAGVVSSYFGMAHSEPRQRFYVSDQQCGKVHVFDADGAHVGRLPGTFGRPRGVFPGPGDTIWVCDWERAELACFDDADARVETIPLRGLGGAAVESRPFLGCVHDGAIHVTADASDGSRKDVVRCPLDGSGPEIVNGTGLRLPCQVRSCRGRLLVSDQTNFLYEWHEAAGRFLPAPDVQLMAPAPYFAEHEGLIFHNASHAVGLLMTGLGHGPHFSWFPEGEGLGVLRPSCLEIARTAQGVRLCVPGSDGAVHLIEFASAESIIR